MTKMPKDPWAAQEYVSYLLRLWQIGDQDRPVWRASLQNSRTGETVGFASLEALFDYLQMEVRRDLSQKSA